jgi:hypothetical protein
MDAAILAQVLDVRGKPTESAIAGVHRKNFREIHGNWRTDLPRYPLPRESEVSGWDAFLVVGQQSAC